jgi:hypothetical protein
MSFKNKGLDYCRLIEDSGGSVKVAAERIDKWINLPENDPMHLSTEDFSLKELYNALHKLDEESGNINEAVHVSQFPTVTATLISKKVHEGWNAAAKVADRLVTPFSSKLQIDKVPGVFLKGDLQDVEPGMPYEHSGDEEEHYVQITGKKRGAILDVTEEAVMFDQTGLIMMRASQFGERAALDREKHVIYTIMDITVNGKNYYCYYPEGTREAVWANADTSSNTHYYDNLIGDVLTNFTDLAAADTLLGLMGDNNNDPILVEPKILLVPRTLRETAIRIVKSKYTQGQSYYFEEPNPFKDRVEIINSPLIDGSGDTNATTNWWYGDFKKQFLEKVVIPLEVQTRRMNDKNDDAWERDIIASYKVRRYQQVGAADYRFVVKSTGAG